MFGRKESKETNGRYSARSQRNWLAQRKFEQNRERCEALIGYCERQIARLEVIKESIVNAQTHGKGSTSSLGLYLTELAERTAELTAYKERKAVLQSQIEALLNPAPQQVAERQERQNYLAKLAAERLEKDRLVGGAIKGLRGLLEERAELTAKILMGAEAADLTVGGDKLDAERFKELLASLPAEVTATSERWHGWFVGDEGGTQSFAVVVDELTLPESLARAHSYSFSDRVELTDEEASELVRDICPVGKAGHDLAWSYEPPRIMPLKEFEALVREAADKGGTPQDLVSRRNMEREEQLKEQYVPEYREVVREHRKAMRAAGLLIGGDPRDD